MAGAGALETLGWVVLLGIGPPLWGSGVVLFARSGLPRARKVLWTLLLVGVGAGIGWLLPLAMIRNRFLVLLLLLPVLALADVRLAASRRGFRFWFRACAFEVCTVFGVAAMVRFAIAVLDQRG